MRFFANDSGSIDKRQRTFRELSTHTSGNTNSLRPITDRAISYHDLGAPHHSNTGLHLVFSWSEIPLRDSSQIRWWDAIMYMVSTHDPVWNHPKEPIAPLCETVYYQLYLQDANMAQITLYYVNKETEVPTEHVCFPLLTTNQELDEPSMTTTTPLYHLLPILNYFGNGEVLCLTIKFSSTTCGIQALWVIYQNSTILSPSRVLRELNTYFILSTCNTIRHSSSTELLKFSYPR